MVDPINSNSQNCLYIRRLRRPASEKRKGSTQPNLNKENGEVSIKKILQTPCVINLNNEKHFIKKYIEQPLATPNISSNAWGVFEGSNAEVIYGKNYNIRKEIASLTKIMTCYTILQLSKVMLLNIKTTYITITKKAALINGTKAELEKGDKISIYDLLYGLMLPSGNDAAIALADYFSKLIYLKLNPTTSTFPSQISKYFIFEMNKNATSLGMKRTTYSNPHGLADSDNKSTAQDIAILASEAMKDENFRNIVKTSEYKAQGFNYLGEKKEFVWTNLNLLLESGFNGIKTGTTPTAGNCLCSSIEKNGKSFIIVVLKSKSPKSRFSETKKILNFITKIYFNDSHLKNNNS